MTDFRERYKRAGYGRENMDVNRALRSQRRDEARKEMRSEHFSLMRNVGSHDDQDDSSYEEDRISKEEEKRNAAGIEMLEKEDEAKRKAAAELEEAIQKRWQRLEKWREERRRKKIQDKKKAKPVFKVGVVHHRVYSPPLNKEAPAVPLVRHCKLKEAQHHEQQQQQQQQTKRVTRATEKRLAMKAVTNQQKRENLRSKKKEIGETTLNFMKKESSKVPLAPKDHQFKAPVGVTAIPLFGRKALEASKENIQLEITSSSMSTTADFPQKIPSSFTESIFASKDVHLFNVSESKKNSSFNRSFSQAFDSMMDESIEALSLKMSSDDQEMLDDQENVDFIADDEKKETPMKRRSSKFFALPEEAMDVQENIESPKKNESLVNGRRSLRMQSSTSVEEKLTPPEMMVQDTQNESVSSVKNKRKSFSRRRSTAILLVDNESPKESEANSSYRTTLDRPNKSVYRSTGRSISLNTSKDIENLKESEVNSNYNTMKSQVNESINYSASKRRSVSMSRQDTESPNRSVKDSSLNYSAVKANRIKSPENRRKSIDTVKITESPKKITKDSSFTSAPSLGLSRKTDSSMQNLSSSKQNETKTPTPKQKSERIRKSFTEKKELPQRTRSMRIGSSSVDESPQKGAVVTPEKLNKSVTSVIKKRRSTRFTSSDSTETSSDNDQINLLEDFVFSKPIDSPRRITARFTESNQEINLMESTFSALPKSIKISNDAPKNLLDDTFSNLSPRRSSRVLKPLPSRPIKVSQSLVKLSPITKTVNATSSTEPTAQNIVDSPMEIEDVHNLSLNMSLPKSTSDADKPPAFFSPYIVQSRGKSSQRKEVQKRRFSQPTLEDIPTKDNIMQKLNISLEEEERTAQYYKHILNQEIDRLNELCDKWNAIKDAPVTLEDVRYIIQAAVGQTQLLINKKFERFRRLVLDCETGKGEMLVTCKDLQGFWDMMYMEIKDCENRFNNLEKLKSNNWVDEEAEKEKQEQKQKNKKPVAKKPAVKKNPVSKPSSLRAHIMAARKKKIDSQENYVQIKNPMIMPLQDTPQKGKLEDQEKTPLKNTRHTSTPKSTNKWQSLMKKVELSNTRKLTTSPLIVMKLSQMCKTPEVQLDDSIVYINSGRTPAKSILKASKDETLGSVVKSTNKVFFKEQPTEFVRFDRQSKNDTKDNAESANIDKDKEPIERKLNFEDESFNFSLSENQEDDEKEPKEVSDNLPSLSSFNSNLKKSQISFMAIPSIVIHPEENTSMISMSPLSLEEKEVTVSAMKRKVGRPKKQISFKDDLNVSPSRSTRKRKFSAPSTPVPNSKDSKVADEDTDMEVDVDQEQMDKSTLSNHEEDIVKELYMNAQGMICERIIKKKKSTPRSSKLKRSNSEASHRKNVQLEEKTLIKTPDTHSLERASIPMVVIDSPGGRQQNVLSTPHVKKSVLKRSVTLDSTLTKDIANDSIKESITPKLRIKTPKSSAKIKINADTNKKNEESATPRLRRTNSKSTKINIENVNKSVNETGTPTLKRRSIKLLNKTNSEDGPVEVSTSTSRRKSSKKLQENVDPNTPKSAEGLNKSNKVSRTPSLKRRNSQKNAESFQSNDILSDAFKQISEEMTPNTRRKSLRLAKTITPRAD